MKLIVTLFAIGFLSAPQVFAHGEDKPGPHGGSIRMPGAFHTELVVKDGVIEVYLLDMEWKNPSTKNSKVALSFAAGGQSNPLPCTAKIDRFECQPPKDRAAKGDLRVVSSREGAPGAAVTYGWPKP